MPKSKYTKKSCTRRSGTDSPGTEKGGNRNSSGDFKIIAVT